MFVFCFFPEMSIYHQGTDAGMFDLVEVVTSEGKRLYCDFKDKGLIDDNGYATSRKCYES